MSFIFYQGFNVEIKPLGNGTYQSIFVVDGVVWRSEICESESDARLAAKKEIDINILMRF